MGVGFFNTRWSLCKTRRKRCVLYLHTRIMEDAWAHKAVLSTVRHICFLAWAFLLGGLAKAQPLAVPKSDPRLVQAADRINQESQTSSQAYLNLRDLTQIGHRMSGTPNGTRAEDFVLLKAKSYGLKPIKFQPFPIQVWQRQHLEFDAVPVNSDHYVQYEAVALAHSPREADVRARLIDCGNGLREDFDRMKDSVNGRVALVNIGLEGPKAGKRNLHRSEKAALALEYGAVGVVFVNSAPGRTLLTGTASVDGNLIAIPALCIGQEAGKALRKWSSEEKLLAQIRMENSFDEREARNVLASIKGKTKPHETIVIGAHLDSWDLATGAVDNGLGSMIILEAARLLKAAGLETDRTIQFVWFMGEEQGLTGSRHFVDVARKKKDLGRIKYMLNCDMAGNAMGWNTFGFGRSAEYFAGVGKLTQARDTAFHNLTESKPELHSDHQAFMLEGIPVADPMGEMPQSVYNCYHSDCDNIKLVEPFYLDRTARALALIAYALAIEKDLPAQRLTEEQTKQLLIKAGLKEKLVLGKDWRWND